MAPRIPLTFSVIMVGCGLLLGAPTRAIAQSQEPFLPTWKLLSGQQKQDFIAGYLHGWRDASRVLDISIEYVRANPTSAVASLEQLRELYDLSHLRPDAVTREVDRFYNDPANREASLGLAISNARNRSGSTSDE